MEEAGGRRAEKAPKEEKRKNSAKIFTKGSEIAKVGRQIKQSLKYHFEPTPPNGKRAEKE